MTQICQIPFALTTPLAKLSGNVEKPALQNADTAWKTEWKSLSRQPIPASIPAKSSAAPTASHASVKATMNVSVLPILENLFS
jgi:hypothetical protein